MIECRSRSISLDYQLYEIGLELAILDDKIEDITTSGYNRYIKDMNNSSYLLEHLMDKKIKLQQRKNNISYKIKALSGIS